MMDQNLERKRIELEKLIPPAQAINNFYPAEQPITHPTSWLMGALILPLLCAAFLWGMQSGYGRAASDVAAAKSEASIAQSKVAQIRACVEGVK